MKETELPAHWKVVIEERVRARSGGRFKTLGAADFPSGQAVELRFPDGSMATFKYAFFVVDEERQELGIFTEHCGHYVFRLPDFEYRVLADPLPRALEAARTLLVLIDTKDTADELERRLGLALDELAVAYAMTPEPSCSDEYPDPARGDYAAMWARCAAAFPGLGSYRAVVDLLSPAVEPTVSMGDALDDLADIALELEAVLERSKTSFDDAIWRFRFGFRTHWGRHLRWLQLVLHERGR